MARWKTHLETWWQCLLHPTRAAETALTREPDAGLFPFIAWTVVGLYALYGATMGVFRGALPGGVSALKMPLLFGCTMAVCFPAFYVANAIVGFQIKAMPSARLLLMAVSANALALGSYAPFSLFFALTTSSNGYAFLVFMHIVVFALSALISVGIISGAFRAAARQAGRPLRPVVVWIWAILYGLVGSEMAWTLRPWIGWEGEAYTIFRVRQESFFESLFRVIDQVF